MTAICGFVSLARIHVESRNYEQTGQTLSALSLEIQLLNNSMNKGMTKVSVLYPNGEGHTFDMDYYTQTHLPLVGGLLGDSLKGSALEKGLGGPGGSPAAFLVMSHLYYDSVEAFEASFGPNAEKIMSDLPNFTNAEPVIQISEVM